MDKVSGIYDIRMTINIILWMVTYLTETYNLSYSSEGVAERVS